jgi:outer membrane protein assembly factor BamB
MYEMAARGSPGSYWRTRWSCVQTAAKKAAELKIKETNCRFRWAGASASFCRCLEASGAVVPCKMSYRHYEIRKTFWSASTVWRPMTLAMLAALSLASQPAHAYSDDWVMGFHDSRHTGQTSEVVTPPLTVAWTWKDTYTYDNGGGGKFTPQNRFWLPVYYRGKVCFQGGLNANRVFCLNPADGTKVWESDNPGYTASGTFLFQFDNYPAAVNGRIVNASTDFTATVDAATGGDSHNAYNTNGGWPSGGIASWNDMAYSQYIRTDDGFEQFNIIQDPVGLTKMAGSYSVPDYTNTYADWSFRVPAVDGYVAYTNFLGTLVAWDALTRRQLWSWGIFNFGSSPAVSNGVVYFYSSSRMQLVALNAAQAAYPAAGPQVPELWSADILNAYSPIVSDGVVYVGSDNNFYALDAATGAVKWTFATGQPFTSLQIPAISGDLVYVPGADGNLYVLRKATGIEAGRYTGTMPWGPVVIGGGMVYASDLTNTVYGFRPQTAAIGPAVTSLSLRRAANNQSASVNITGTGFFAGGAASAVQSIVLDNAAGTVLTGYTVTGDQAISGVVVPAGIVPGMYHIKVRSTVGNSANEPVFEVAGTNSSLISALGQSPGLYGTGTQSGFQRHLVRTSNGTLIAVYIGPQGSSWRPATYNISRDGGLTWTGQTQLLNAIIWAPSSSVWVDKQDRLNVSYLIGYHQALAKFAVGKSDLLSLDPGFPVVVSSLDGLAQTGPMVSESGGRLWVAYKVTKEYDPPYSVIALYSDDAGLTWTRTPQITAAGSSPALALYQDKPAVIYAENGFLVWATWNGQQWNAARILPSAIAGVQQSPSAAVTSDGQIHVAYSTASGGVYYARYSGSAWSAPQTIDAAGSGPSLTSDGASLWCFYANSTRNLAYRRTSNGLWNPAVAVTSDGNYNTSPATLTLSPDAWIPVIWTSGTSASGYVVKSAVIPGDGPALPSAALGVTETPNGSFTQGQSGAGYTVTVSNSASAGPSSGTVTVTETAPAGLTLVSMAGNGWSCSGNSCARSDVLNASFSYPAITVTVDVAASAPSPVTSQVAVSGGNSAPASASNTAVVIPAPILSIVETHSGNFSQGQTAAVYIATVSNQTGAGPTSGTVTVTGTTPVGLTPVSMGGSGWVCSVNTCTRADVLNAGASYPPVAVTVSVDAGAPGSATNMATISGGGDVGGTNHTATDPAIVNPITDVSGQVKVIETGLGRNRGTGIWAATLTVTNTNAVAINGPVQVILSKLSVNATMVNNTGVRNGSPYITVSPGVLAPGTSVSVSIQFTNPSNGYIDFIPLPVTGVF